MVDVGPGITDLLGLTREEWLATPEGWRDLLHPDDLDRIVDASERSVATGEPFREQYRAIHRDGREVWIREEAIRVDDDEGNPQFWLGLMFDISDSVRTERELVDAQTRYGALVEHIPAIVYVDLADERMTTTYVSPQIESLLGITPAEYMEDPDLWQAHLHPDDRDGTVAAYMAGRAIGEPFTLEYRLVARDGRVLWFSDSAVVVHGPAGEPLYLQGVMLDITKRKDAEEQIAFLAYHDKLTGLPNRVLFDELLELSLARARRHGLGVSVISVDIDNFKLVNDSLGHEAGDELIVLVAERLREATRETDLVARPGGDEFLMLLADLELPPTLPEGDPAAVVAESVASRIQASLRQPFEVAGTELYVTASLGISLFPRHADDAGTLMKHADNAMFRSKQLGPGWVVPARRERRGRDGPAVAQHAAPEGRREPELDAPLPTAHRPRDGRDDRRGGVDPLARTGWWVDPAGRVHPARRGDGSDRGDRRLGGRGAQPAGRAVACRRTLAGDQLQPLAEAAVAARCRRQGHLAPAARGDGSGAPHRRDHRVDGHDRPGADAGDPGGHARSRPPPGDRRFRNGLLVARAPA